MTVPTSERVRDYLLNVRPNASVSEVTTKFGIDKSRFYRLRKQLLNKGRLIKVGETYYQSDDSPNSPQDDCSDPTSNGCLTIEDSKEKSISADVVLSIKATGLTEIKVRDEQGTLIGTIDVCRKGIWFRRPNQKMKQSNVLQWKMLEKIQEIGLI